MSIYKEFWWSVHNLLAHPLSEVVWLASFCGKFDRLAQLSHWIHDVTLPEEEKKEEVEALPDMKLCGLKDGNGTEFPFSLSVHAAWMLVQGLYEYSKSTVSMYERKIERGDYCLLRVGTNIKVAKQLIEWMKEVDPEYLRFSITELEVLIDDLEKDRDKFIEDEKLLVEELKEKGK